MSIQTWVMFFCFSENPVDKEDEAKEVWEKVFEMYDRDLHVTGTVTCAESNAIHQHLMRPYQ